MGCWDVIMKSKTILQQDINGIIEVYVKHRNEDKETSIMPPWMDHSHQRPVDER
jgi:hypothetical protein